MKKDTLLETLKSNSVALTAEEIETIMSEELEKNPDEMDCELIDLCSDILEKAYADKEEKPAAKKKRIKLGKIIIIAAAVILILGVSIPVGAKFVHTEASEKIVQFFEDHFIMFNSSRKMKADSHSDKKVDLVKSLTDFGFDSIILPSEFFADDYDKEIEINQDDEYYLNAEISFKNTLTDTEGFITISKHKTEDTQFVIGTGEMSTKYTTVKQLTVNGMDVLIFQTDENYTSIIYADKDTEYDIQIINCDLDTAVKIAETLINK